VRALNPTAGAPLIRPHRLVSPFNQFDLAAGKESK
jgi:hypothetical protein